LCNIHQKILDTDNYWHCHMPLQYSIAHLLNEITKTCNISYSKCVPSNGNMVLGENSVWFYPTLHRYPIQFRCCHSDKKARNPAARERKLNSVTFYRHDRASSWQHFYLLTLQLPWHAEVHKMIFYYIAHALISDIIFALWAHYITVSYSTHICSYWSSWPGQEDDHIL